MTTNDHLKIARFLLAAATALCLTSAVRAEVVLSTDFTGRTVSGKIASNITWVASGVQDPGDLLAVDEPPTSPAFSALFDTANAQGHFAPDLNIGNEGPWSVTIPLTLTAAQIFLEEVVIDWQHFNNSGAFQGVNRSADWTVSVTGSVSGPVGTVMVSGISGTSGVETLTFTTPLNLSNAETYEVKIFVAGSNTTGNNTGLDGVTLNGVINNEPDTTPPAVSTLSPIGGAMNVSPLTNLVVTFDEFVRAGTGTIVIRRASDNVAVETIDVNAVNVTIIGDQMTINPAGNLAGLSGVYVEIAAGALEDFAGNGFGGITGPAGWSFTTGAADTTAPVVIELSPADDATDVGRGSDLLLTFDEDVQIGAGAIEIRRTGDDSVAETIDVNAGAVTVGGPEVRINPVTFLAGATRYYVQVAAGAVQDPSGNPFAGISDSTTWSFTTETVPMLAVEFNQDDQEGFEIWPVPIAGTTTTAEFSTDPLATSGTTTVTVRASTTLSLPANRGSLDGVPPGYTYQHLYEDLLHATTPTGILTLDFSGLNPTQPYRFTLYAWDPSATDASDKEWTVTGGAGEPSVGSVNFLDPLVDNRSFALVFEITATATGTFQLSNTNGLSQSAINGFTLDSLGAATPLRFVVANNGASLDLEWDSKPGFHYNLRSSTDLAADLSTWDTVEVDGGFDIVATPPVNMHTIVRPGEPLRFYRVEEFPPPPLLAESFDGVVGPGLPVGWTTGAGATAWEVGDPTGGAFSGPLAAKSGPNCAGTDITADYAALTSYSLVSPAIAVPAGGATLRFQQFIDTDEAGDVGTIRILDADNADALLEVLNPPGDIEGISAGWSAESIPLPASTLGQTIRIEFRLESNDNLQEFAGFYVDDVLIEAN